MTINLNLSYMKRLVLISTLLLSTVLGMAAQDPKAKEILDKVSQINRNYRTIQIDFTFTLNNPKTKKSETNTGWVALKGKSYRLHMPAMGMDVYSDGKTTWSYLTESNEVNITEADPESDAALNPANLFTIYEKGFNNIYAGEENAVGKPCYVIDLVPQAKKEYTKVRLYIDKTKYEIAKAISYNKDGNTYTLSLKNMKTNQNLADDFFKFNPAKFPKVQVNDMR
jgi:outer membrane lipoprotein-sorting protein